MGPFDWRLRLREGVVIPAHPLALTSNRKLDEGRQRSLTRYYLDAGAGGIAVGVHTTQFAIRRHGLYEPVLALAREEAGERGVVKIAGVCGTRVQALWETECAARLGYDAVLLSFGALANATTDQLIEHARAVGEVLPLIGFYLQPAVGGRALDVDFWRRFAALDSVAAIKIAPFNRYATLEVLRGTAESGRAAEIALYTGNDDHIVLDLLTSFRGLRMVGGLLGQWAVWTRRAVEISGGHPSRPCGARNGCNWRSASPTPTARSSMRQTLSADALPVYMRSCVARVYLRAFGAWTPTKGCRPVSSQRSIESARPTLN